MKAPLSYGLCLWGLFLAGSTLAFDEPSLSITNAQPAFIVSWPELAPGWVLERATHLDRPVPWTRVSSELYQTNATSRQVSVFAAEGSQFFRLRKFVAGAPGLTGYWQLDEGMGQVAGEGVGAGPAMLLTNTSWAAGRFGPGALRFNGAPAGGGGSRAWVSNTGYRALPPSGQPFSVSLWFSPDALTPGWHGLAGNDVTGTNGWRVALQSVGPGTNYLVFAATGGVSSLSVTGRTLLLPGQWRQLTVTHDGAEGTVYLDGEMLARGAGNLQTHDGPLYFGGSVGNYDSFLGRIDDIRAYTNCLTPEQVSLTGHWRFNEGIGSYSADNGTRGRAARVVNPTAWAAGRDGAGIELSAGKVMIGNEEYGVLPASGGSFSVSLWVRPHSWPGGRSGLMSCGTGSSNGWELAVEADASGQTLHFCSTNRGGTLDLSASVVMTDGAWTKLDLTYNGGIATAYVNGRQVQARNGAIRGSAAPLMVGEAPGAANFNGVIDDLKVYSRERGAAEIGPVAQTMWETVFLNSTTNLPLKGFGPAGKPLTYSVVPIVAPTNGGVSLTPGSASATYAAGGTKGPDAFTYTVSDGEFTSPPAIVTVSVVKPHWLSPSGGSAGPQDGTSPERAWAAGAASALDALWKTNRYYDCFYYAPGVYETTGFYVHRRSTSNPGCKHIGTGSTGAGRTTLRLVDVWEPWNEGTMFATLGSVDNFEVHQMEIDCNGDNVPKYTRGQPVLIRIPLTTTTRVDTVTLRWDSRAVLFTVWLQTGRAAEFSVCARRSGLNTFVTNCVTVAGTGQVDVVTVGAEADELIVQLDRRAVGVDFYSLREIEVSGGKVSLPTATIPGGGESRLDPSHSILAAVDDAKATFWASGPESQSQIALPLAPGTSISQVSFDWNCKTLPGVGRLGPAAEFQIRAHDENTGQYYDVPFVRHGRTADGWETATFGTAQSPNVILTDQLVILLTSRESGVDYYSFRQVSLQDGAASVVMRMPAAPDYFTWDQIYSVPRAFDGNADTQWTCGTQGQVSAIDMYGSNLKFTGLKIIGFGTKGARECFPIFVSSTGKTHQPERWGNVLIEDCVLAEPATANRDGVTALALTADSPASVTNAVVRRCTFDNLGPYFPWSQATMAIHVENCLVDNCAKGSYFEPDAFWADDIGPVLVRSNQFFNVDNGVHLLMHTDSRFDSITCIGNEIVLSPRGGWGFSVCDVCDPGPSASITNVTFLNNIIRYPDWNSSPAGPHGGFYHSDIHHAVIGNNLIALGTSSALRVRGCPYGFIPAPLSTEDCDHPGIVPPGPSSYPPCLDVLPVGYQRTWFNNRDLSSALLEVRFLNNNVDGAASQQQRPE